MSDDEELYDEFGNYIGPELDSSSDEDDDSDVEQKQQQPAGGGAQIPDDASDVSDGDHQQNAMVVAGGGASAADDTTAEPMNAIVLHEDKDHYASAEQTYGEEVHTAVLDEDAMDLETPIVEPVSVKQTQASASLIEDEDWNYTEEYLTKALLSNETTATRRGIALIGHLHHGKTSLVDCLLEPTLRKSWGPRASLEDSGPRYLDILKAEQERQMSLTSTPLTALLPDTRGKTYAITMVDCPGHVQFHDETVAALKAVDGAVVCIDAVEGIMMHTEMSIKAAVAEGLAISLCITKVDRLIVELKLPPRDTYYKLLNIIEACNNLIGQASRGRYPPLHPSRGNVVFSSALHGWLFSLQSFAEVYLEHHDSLGMDATEFAKRLWGDSFCDPSTKQFHKNARDCSTRVERTFVTFILEPMYKIYTACLGEREQDVNRLLRSLGVLLSKKELRSSARPLLRMACSKFLETASCGFVDMVVKHV